MKKNKLLILTIISVIIIFTGCGLSKEQESEASQYEEQAGKNAVEYIQGKYGIKAKVISTEYNRTGLFADAVSNYVDVHMSYEGREFDVCISGAGDIEDLPSGEKKNSADNFQHGEILSDLKKYLEDNLGVEVEAVYYEYCSNEESALDNLTNQNYEGDIKAFVDSQGGQIEVTTLDKDNTVNLDVIQFEKGEVQVFSYDKSFYKEHGHVLENGERPGYYALWLNWYLVESYKDYDDEMTTFKQKNIDNVTIVYSSEHQVEIDKVDVDAGDWKGEDYENPVALSEGIQIETQNTQVFVFSREDNEDVSWGMTYESKGNSKFEEVTHDKLQYGYLCSLVNVGNFGGKVTIVLLEDK